MPFAALVIGVDIVFVGVVLVGVIFVGVVFIILAIVVFFVMNVICLKVANLFCSVTFLGEVSTIGWLAMVVSAVFVAEVVLAAVGVVTVGSFSNTTLPLTHRTTTLSGSGISTTPLGSKFKVSVEGDDCVDEDATSTSTVEAEAASSGVGVSEPVQRRPFSVEIMMG